MEASLSTLPTPSTSTTTPSTTTTPTKPSSQPTLIPTPKQSDTISIISIDSVGYSEGSFDLGSDFDDFGVEFDSFDPTGLDGPATAKLDGGFPADDGLDGVKKVPKDRRIERWLAQQCGVPLALGLGFGSRPYPHTPTTPTTPKTPVPASRTTPTKGTAQEDAESQMERELRHQFSTRTMTTACTSSSTVTSSTSEGDLVSPMSSVDSVLALSTSITGAGAVSSGGSGHERSTSDSPAPLDGHGSLIDGNGVGEEEVARADSPLLGLGPESGLGLGWASSSVSSLSLSLPPAAAAEAEEPTAPLENENAEDPLRFPGGRDGYVRELADDAPAPALPAPASVAFEVDVNKVTLFPLRELSDN